MFIQNAGTVLVDVESPGSAIPLATWTHVVLSQDGVSPKLYINSVEQSLTLTTTTDLTAWHNTMTTPNVCYFGAINFGGGGAQLHFDGNMDDLRYYQYPLSQSQIDDIYNSGSGTETFTLDTITVPTTEATADANSVLLLNCNTYDASLSYQIPRFEGDASAAINGLVSGSNGALILDGVNEYLSASTSADFEFSAVANTQGTISTFFSIDIVSVGDDNIVSHWDTINDFDQPLKINFGNFLTSGGRTGGSTSWNVTEGGDNSLPSTEAGGALNANQVYHVACIRNGNFIGLYLDGTQIGGDYYDFTASGYNVGGSMFIGQRGDSTGYFPGKIDDTFMTQNNHFSATPMDDPYLHFRMNDSAANIFVVDSGSGGLNGGMNGTSPNTQDRSVTGHVPQIDGSAALGLDLNGSDNFINMNGSVHTKLQSDTIGSIVMWVNPDSIGTDWMLFSASSSPNPRYGAMFIRSTGELASNFTNGTGTQVCSYNSTNTISASAWTHVVMTQDGTQLRMYINGTQETLVGLVTTTPGAWFATSAGAGFDGSYIGTYSINGGGFNLHLDGQLDDFRYYDSPLSTAQVANIYNSGTGTERILPSTITVPTTAFTDFGNAMFALGYEPFAPFTDSSTGGAGSPHTFTESGGDPHVSGRFSTGMLYLDGTGDYIEFPNRDDNQIMRDGKEDVTFQCWFRNGSPGSTQAIFSHYESANDFIAVQHVGASNLIQLAVNIDGVALIRQNAPHTSDRRWHHYVLFKKGSESSAGSKYGQYVDGNQIGYTEEAQIQDQLRSKSEHTMQELFGMGILTGFNSLRLTFSDIHHNQLVYLLLVLLLFQQLPLLSERLRLI